MKKAVISVLVVGFLALSSTAFADESAQKKQKVDSGDPCTVVLCMWGKVNGESQSACSKSESRFFSIIGKKHGKFNGSRTSNERNGFLGQCSAADPDAVKKIISKFGSVRGY